MLVLIGVRNLIIGYAIRPALYGRTVKIRPGAGAHRAARGVRAGRGHRPVRGGSADRGRCWPWRPRPSPSWNRTRRLRCRAWYRPGSTGWPSGAGVCSWGSRSSLSWSPSSAWSRWSWSRSSSPSWSPRPWDPWSGGSSRGATRARRASAITVGGGFLIITGVLVLTTLSLIDQAGALADGVDSGMRSVNETAGGQLGLLTDGVAARRPRRGPAHRHPWRERRDGRRHRAPGHAADLLPAAGRWPTVGAFHQPRPISRPCPTWMPPARGLPRCSAATCSARRPSRSSVLRASW